MNCSVCGTAILRGFRAVVAGAQVCPKCWRAHLAQFSRTEQTVPPPKAKPMKERLTPEQKANAFKTAFAEPTPKQLLLLLGVNRHYQSEEIKLLTNALAGYSLYQSDYIIDYCYTKQPPSRKAKASQQEVEKIIAGLRRRIRHSLLKPPWPSCKRQGLPCSRNAGVCARPGGSKF
jgi:hypothetical protein